MARCVIHIGMHKTGSTSIQSSLDGFNDGQFYYANLGKDPNHSLAMFSMFSEKSEKHHLHEGKSSAEIQNYISTSWQLLEQSIKAAGNRTLIISGEGVGLFSRATLQKLYEYFSKYYKEIVMVGYVRPPVGFITSGFQERVKVVPVAKFSIAQEYRNYKESFTKFDEIFNIQNVQLWKFDPKSFPNGCVVQDFCSRLGILLPPDKIVRTNESLSLQAVALLYTYRKYAELYDSYTLKGGECIRLGRLIEEMGCDKLRFSPELMRPILKKNHQDIAWMEKRIGVPLYEEINQLKPTDIKDESDFLEISRALVPQLLSLFNRPASEYKAYKSPKSIVRLVYGLRSKLNPNKFQSELNPPFVVNSGHLARAEQNLVAGWAVGHDPNKPIRVKLIVNGEPLAEQLANLNRPSLKKRGMHPTGACGFAFTFNGDGLLRIGDSVAVEPVVDEFKIKNSPKIVSC